MAYASVEDVALRLGVAIDTLNTAQVQAVLDDTSALVYAATGRDFSAEVEVPEPIRWVVISRTTRFLRNPNGLRNESVGPFSYSYAAEAAVLIGGWTDEERQVLDTYGTLLSRRRGGTTYVGYGDDAAVGDEE